jgi:hypothetical protein
MRASYYGTLFIRRETWGGQPDRRDQSVSVFLGDAPIFVAIAVRQCRFGTRS